MTPARFLLNLRRSLPATSDSGDDVTDDVQARAEARLEEALAASGARDPREFYRQRLKELRELDRSAYDRAVAWYRDTLIPAIGRDGADPLPVWTEYGRQLAELGAPGRTLCVDASGRAHPYEQPADLDHLVIHLPDARRGPALLVGLPRELSAPQRATFDWLVQGRTSMKEAG